MSEQNGYISQYSYDLYDTTGATEDWSYYSTGGLGYTFEIGFNEFHPPFEETIGEYVGAGAYAGKGNREAFFLAMEHAADASKHSVITGLRPGRRAAAPAQGVRDRDLPGAHDVERRPEPRRGRERCPRTRARRSGSSTSSTRG